MNVVLKPCPFCGGKAEASESPNSRSEEGESFYEVRCKKCGVHVTGKSFNFWTVEYNAEKPQDLLSAVRRWNKRAYEKTGRKTGKWIDHRGDGYVECPICGNLTVCGGSIEELHYCFWCGAKMEGEGDETD